MLTSSAAGSHVPTGAPTPSLAPSAALAILGCDAQQDAPSWELLAKGAGDKREVALPFGAPPSKFPRLANADPEPQHNQAFPESLQGLLAGLIQAQTSMSAAIAELAARSAQVSHSAAPTPSQVPALGAQPGTPQLPPVVGPVVLDPVAL